MDSGRQFQLNKFFKEVLDGKTVLRNQKQASLFLDSIRSQPDPAKCVDLIMASSCGLKSVQQSFRMDVSISFLNSPSAPQALLYFQAPELRNITGGDFLNEIIAKILDPPIFWNKMCDAYKGGTLEADAQCAFAGLLLQAIMLPGVTSATYRETAQEDAIIKTLLTSKIAQVRQTAQKISHVLSTITMGTTHIDDGESPGGRHDNDFVDFREIAILPTGDEIECKERAFLRRQHEVDEEVMENRISAHLDSQFRLLREDMMYSIREEAQITLGKKKGRQRGLIIDNACLSKNMYCGHFDQLDDKNNKYSQFGIVFECPGDFWVFKKVPKNITARKAFLKNDSKGQRVMKHQSTACIVADGKLAALATIYRDEDHLAKIPPNVILQISGKSVMSAALSKLHSAKQIKIVQVDTAIFSYQPVLEAIQGKKEFPMAPELLFWKPSEALLPPPKQPTELVRAMQFDVTQNLQPYLGSKDAIELDRAQGTSLLSAFTQRVSLIQGPPGTGKSFIGAIFARAIHKATNAKIMVVCYTNHALDQFLEDLMNIGIPQADIVRLGSKSSPATESLAIYHILRESQFNRKRVDWELINGLKNRCDQLAKALRSAFDQYYTVKGNNKILLSYLEFQEPEYYTALTLPSFENGMIPVTKKNKAIKAGYLLFQWINGWDAGVLKGHEHIAEHAEVWKMPKFGRDTLVRQWTREILQDRIDQIVGLATSYNDAQARLARKENENVALALKSKRIIACTTTAAAKYRIDIQASAADVLLVEEAGEILESHIIAALGRDTSQLVLIGDHKQLRPKVENYALSVEKGDGFDLNRSLFERLVLKGYPHCTLASQHRMRPEISDMVRHLTYPDLLDAPKTINRPDLRGVQSNVVFINHSEPEDEAPELADRSDGTGTSSKQNSFEADMVLSIVRYLAQQGYGTDRIVVLTPYLGQLRLFQEKFRNTHDAVLNDLDTFDLVRAGLVPAASAQVSKKRIRLATIDNYQGEESDIVILSFTRSNAEGSIGFMAAPERLNVALSRAREGLIMIGNVDTFLAAKKGNSIWLDFITYLKDKRMIHDGLPVFCEQHPDRKTVLASPDKFEINCPDGGCDEPCGTLLSCQLHKCPSRCHQLHDHSQMRCDVVMQDVCPTPQQHVRRWKCFEKSPTSCKACDKAEKIAAGKRARALEHQLKRDAENLAHERKMESLEKEMAVERQTQQDARAARERDLAIAQKTADLHDLRAQGLRSKTRLQLGREVAQSTSPLPTQLPSLNNIDKDVFTVQAPGFEVDSGIVSANEASVLEPSPSVIEWNRRKILEGANNEALESIMQMVGLEDVKARALGIKDKVDIQVRQGISMQQDRMNAVFVGNPGTGKTTVARHYAAFLVSMEILPGETFIETTGSRLANEGIAGAKKHIETVLSSGGGAIFVDEAYQLTDGNNFGGKQVLDFLLAEMENNTGKIVFLFAGYVSEMDRFFEHNPGLRSRVPHKFSFSDYSDEELLSMFSKMIDKRYKGRMRVEGGMNGLFCRVAVRRLGRGRGQNGFGNARALENLVSKIHDRQASRVTLERREGRRPDDLLLTEHDIIGPDPSKALSNSRAWKELQAMIGLDAIKRSIDQMASLLKLNHIRDLNLKEPVQVPLHRVFLGNPGTGKTTVAKKYGQILTEMGLLSNGEVVIKNPSDFIGSVIGGSEAQTKAILASTVGKVLIIDEAYMLYGGSGGDKSSDQYKTAVIDTIVAEVQGFPGEDRCVLLLGYRDKMEEMFQNVNPGLSRRFAIEDAFDFEDFSDPELRQILDYKLKNQQLAATDAAKDTAIDVLGRSRDRPNFGNAGEVENLLAQAKKRYQTRRSDQNHCVDIVFEPQDFDPEHDRIENASNNLYRLFEDVIGCEAIIQKLAGFQEIVRKLKKNGKDVRGKIPMNFLFKGPPGTGKTTTARKIGQIFMDMGLLSSNEVVECSASDLIGQYVGQTSLKTRQLMEKALGKVLFVDEAYRLCDGPFAKDAMDELTGIMTNKKFMNKIVIVLAGYDQQINQLLASNPGLSSRFSEEVVFPNIPAPHCFQILLQTLAKDEVTFPEGSEATSVTYQSMLAIFTAMSELPSWGNARDVVTIAKRMSRFVLCQPGNEMVLTGKDALMLMSESLATMKSRLSEVPLLASLQDVSLLRQQSAGPLPTTRTTTATTGVSVAENQPENQETGSASPLPVEAGQARDAGVSDAIWQQLQLDREHAISHAQDHCDQMAKLEAETVRAKDEEAKSAAALHTLAIKETQSKDEAERQELKKLREEARMREINAKAERERLQSEVEQRRRREEAARQQEAKAQAALRQMGVCCAGFRWIKQGGGYRCAGGSHFVTNDQLCI